MKALKSAGFRLLVRCGAALLLLAGAVGVFWVGRDPVGLGAGSRVVSPGAGADAGAGRGTERAAARTAIQGGRFAEAFASYRGLEARSFAAEDLSAIGTGLLERDHLTLGWTALEAARRVDVRHEPTNRALDDLQGKLALAFGPTAGGIRQAADEVEFLCGVRDGPPLGMLVLGLAGYSGDPAHERDFLDRLLVRDRAVLRAVATIDDAVKLVARLLLETGRPAEARDVLRPFLAHTPGPGPGAGTTAGSQTRSGIDREAAWLLSRAALQLDENETADAMHELAAGFGSDDNPSPEPAPYIGSRRCAACHLAIFQAQQGHSPHAQTLYVGSGLKEVPLPAQPVPDPVTPGITHRFSRPADDRIELETRVDHQAIRALIRYAVGSGRHGITMIGRDQRLGADRQLRVSYFSAEQAWGETKGITIQPRDLADSIGLSLSSKSLRQCLHCHATWFRAVDPLPSLPRGPEAYDRGIGCERCHGPGLNHDKAVTTGFAELAIGRTVRTPARELLQSCNECHASNGSVEPGDPEFTRVQGTTLMFSRCFTATRGAIHCSTCHDPHRRLETNLAHYDAQCLACHTSPPTQSRPAQAERPGSARPGPPVCPVNPATDCVSCHMPKVEDPSRRARFTDHHIRAHRLGGG
jgi:hypothetical protein